MLNIAALLLFTASVHSRSVTVYRLERCPADTIYVDGRCQHSQSIADYNTKNTPDCASHQIFDGAVCRDANSVNGLANNIVTAPPNCPDGQQLINGRCIEVWPLNIITVPPNCPPGQQAVNGVCVEVWPTNVLSIPSDCPPGLRMVEGRCVEMDSRNAITVPQNCPPGQQWVNGQCRDIWLNNVAAVPFNCPYGFQYVNGRCSQVSSKNVVTLPANCPAGQELVNGQCRDIWLYKTAVCRWGEELIDGRCRTIIQNNIENPTRSLKFMGDEVDKLVADNSDDYDTDRDEESPDGDRNIITIPNHCPAGFKPDSNGICREIWSF